MHGDRDAAAVSLLATILRIALHRLSVHFLLLPAVLSLRGFSPAIALSLVAQTPYSA